MKKELFLMMLSIILLSSFQTKYYSGFIVNIKNYNCNIPFLISKDCSNNFDTLNVNNGFLDEKILITYPTYIKVKYGSFSKMIYLAPDNSLKLSFDLKQIEETFKFEGIGANENYLLDTLYKIGKIDYSRIYNKSLSITRSRYIDSSFNSLKDYFNNLAKVKSVNAEFIEYTNKLLDYEAAGYKIDNSYNDSLCNKLLNEVNLENEKYLSIPSFRNYIVVLLNCSANNLIAKSNGSESFYAFVDAELKITESINQPRIKEFLVFNSVYYLLFNMGVKNFDKYYTYFNLHNTDTTYSNLILKVYNNTIKPTSNKNDKFQTGKPAPNFTCFDNESKPISLSSFTGKYIYLDFWATWCKPCREELPFYLKLQSDYKDKNIAFVSISLDDNKEKWLKSIKENKSKITNLIAQNGMGSDVAKNYQIRGVPRFILIDTFGRLIDIDAPIPSSNEIRVKLDSLLNK